ncbi:MAG: NADH-quinone oxidoreductase subunit A [Candidatus Eiseniibacteriota bacterium]|nr:MAG: NADH-quinone oxidoreductase subunit A [Candidatus Eisenbacteria bacterium]
MLLEYIPILVWICLTTGVAAAILLFSHLIGRKRPSDEKLSPYECGIVPTGDARTRIPIKFYMVAMVFLIFDIEAAFLYPWAVVYRNMLFVGLIEMGLFMLILLAGFVYIWKKGVFDWED